MPYRRSSRRVAVRVGVELLGPFFVGRRPTGCYVGWSSECGSRARSTPRTTGAALPPREHEANEILKSRDLPVASPAISAARGLAWFIKPHLERGDVGIYPKHLYAVSQQNGRRGRIRQRVIAERRSRFGSRGDGS